MAAMSALTPDPAELQVRFSADPSTSGADRLVVLLHGFGADEADMLGVAPHLPDGFVVAAPRAPFALPWGGRAWYPLELVPGGIVDAPAYATQAAAAAAVVLEWLAGQAGCWREVFIGGFSQGASVGLAAMAARPEAADGWLVLSGFVAPGTPEPAPADPLPRVFWSRDVADPVVPARWAEATQTWLDGHARVDVHTYPGLGHSLDARVIADLDAFLVAG